ncbi:hypothetical protein OBP_226 [Pseudomonas phage OBP]|uniref:hypothetical protein n=1 Tax=Pseudomonas phage OBP TaxID=1124849 RepID=UPI000240D5C6|nr:hypothetical protein OBP_226 [Pseudomonas phage OBP]AEV89663.1 hypothetical protein OBP_226 [Pseudomonas phage OBP]
MIVVTGVNNKKVKDPVFLSARKWMEERIRKLEAQGPSSELELAKKRYTGLTAEDVIIEPPVSFSNGNELACFVSRKTGFLRGDFEVEKVDVSLIFEEFAVTIRTHATTMDLVGAIKNGNQQAGVVFITETSKYGLVMERDDVNPDNAMKLMGDIYWDTIETDYQPIDMVSWNSGVFGITALNIDALAGHLYVIEDVQAVP